MINNEAILNEDGLTIKSGIKKVYNFLADTGEFTGTNEEYLQIGVGIPAHSTLLAAPECSTHEVAVFSVPKNAWTIVADYRGETVYSTNTGEAQIVSDIGPIPDNTTLVKPHSAAVRWDGEKWVDDPEKAKQLEIDEAEAMKKSLIAFANSKTNDLVVDYNLGLLDEAQTEELKSWRIYIRALEKVDTSNAPNIDWPVMPEAATS